MLTESPAYQPVAAGSLVGDTKRADLLGKVILVDVPHIELLAGAERLAEHEDRLSIGERIQPLRRAGKVERKPPVERQCPRDESTPRQLFLPICAVEKNIGRNEDEPEVVGLQGDVGYPSFDERGVVEGIVLGRPPCDGKHGRRWIDGNDLMPGPGQAHGNAPGARAHLENGPVGAAGEREPQARVVAISTVDVASFLPLAILVGIALSAAAVALEELTFRRYPRWGDLLRLFSASVIENLGYRQLNQFWRLHGTLSALRGARYWGTSQRRGFEGHKPAA